MRILYCLDGTNSEQISRAQAIVSHSEALAVGVLYVIDSGPREDIARSRQRFLRTPVPMREDEMRRTEAGTSREILNEGARYLPGAEIMERQGHPEREIVNCAAEWRADLVVVCARAEYGAMPGIGPKSVGHVARFVLDHAPCPVLLLRRSGQEHFPISK